VVCVDVDVVVASPVMVELLIGVKFITGNETQYLDETHIIEVKMLPKLSVEILRTSVAPLSLNGRHAHIRVVNDDQ
jgi:hypothetical protein